MKHQSSLKHEFVEFIPKNLPDGVIFISIPYTTAIHNCCCGCGSRVVTPLSPVDWTLIFDGRSISLNPSIGNWNFPCRSHYWIRNNKVIWSYQMSDDEIAGVKEKDDRDSSDYFGGISKPEGQTPPSGAKARRKRKSGFKGLLEKWFGGNPPDNG
jgi:hypothetical protein